LNAQIGIVIIELVARLDLSLKIRASETFGVFHYDEALAEHFISAGCAYRLA
jgi:hypothetical protein